MRPGPQEGGGEEEGPAVLSSRKAKGAAVGVLQQLHFVAAIRRLDQQPQNVQRVGGDPLPEDETLVLRKTIHPLQQPLGWAAHVFRRGGHDYDTRIAIPPPKGMGHPSTSPRQPVEFPWSAGAAAFLAQATDILKCSKNSTRLRREG